MTNEEVIERGGDKMLEELWENNLGFIKQQAARWCYSGRGARLSDNEQRNLYKDLIQCGFLAVADAAEHYNPDRGTFINVLSWYIKINFHKWCAALSGWTLHQYRECVKDKITVDSLNRQIDIGNSDDQMELEDIIADPDDQYAEIEERLYIESLHNKLSDTINSLTEEEARAIRLKYWGKQSISQIGEKLGVDDKHVKQTLITAMKRLRKMARANNLQSYIEQRTSYYSHVGVNTFQNTGISSVERVAMWRESMMDTLTKQYLDKS